MLAYLDDAQLKTDFLAEIVKHEEQDAFIKGTYGQMNGLFRGCAIGCALHSLNVLQGKVGKASAVETNLHSRYEAELGLPTWFAYLEDHLFESLPNELSKKWPRRLAEAIPVGAVVDDVVLAKILRWSLADEAFGARYATDDAEIRGHIDGVIAGFDAEISSGGHASADQREAAARATWAAWGAWGAWADAAWYARDASAAWAARATWAAWAAWDARAAWVARAAWDALAARDARDARAAFFQALSEFVIQTVSQLEPIVAAR